VDAADADAKLVQQLQRKLDDLTADYEAIVARYNRLAAINSTPPVQVQSGPDNRQVMKMLMLQSLFQRRPAPLPIDVRTMDCTKFPALCVGH
jgi:hypothetical protein